MKKILLNPGTVIRAANAEAKFRSEARIQEGVNFTEAAWKAYVRGTLSQDLRQRTLGFDEPAYTVFDRGCIALHKLADPTLERRLRLERDHFFEKLDEESTGEETPLFEEEMLRVFLAQFYVAQQENPRARKESDGLKRGLAQLSTPAYDRLCVVLKPYDPDIRQAVEGLVSSGMRDDLARDTVKDYVRASALGAAEDFLKRNAWAQRIRSAELEAALVGFHSELPSRLSTPDRALCELDPTLLEKFYLGSGEEKSEERMRK